MWQLSAILTMALKSNTHPWLRVVHIGISVIFNSRCDTQEAELHYYAFATLKINSNSHCKRCAKKTSFDLQKDLVHAEFTEVQVQCDAAQRRLVKKLRMCKKQPKYWTVENWKEYCFQMKVIFVSGKHSRFINGNSLLFHMTQPISRSTIKAIACSKPTISENQSK